MPPTSHKWAAVGMLWLICLFNYAVRPAIFFLFAAGQTTVVPALVLARAGFGFFKGLYDANTWASLYDVVPRGQRAAAVGVMNSIGWLGGGSAPVLIAVSERLGWSASIRATALVYLLAGVMLATVIHKVTRSPKQDPVLTAAMH